MMTGAMAMGMKKIALKKLEPRRRSLRITASSSPSPAWMTTVTTMKMMLFIKAVQNTEPGASSLV